MAPVRAALNLILENHNPYPAVVMDGNWNMLMANQSQQQFLIQIAGNKPLPTNNILESVFSEDGFRPYIANWEEVASHLLRRLRKQVLAYSNPQQEALYKRLLGMSPPQNWPQPDKSGDDGPMLTVDFKIGEHTLSLFSTLSQFGTALDIGMQELLIESYFPANDFSKQFFSELSREASD